MFTIALKPCGSERYPTAFLSGTGLFLFRQPALGGAKTLFIKIYAVVEEIVGVLEQRMMKVLRREYRLAGRYAPVYPQGRVAPCNGGFTLRAIEVVALILEDGRLAEHAEAMGKAARNKELAIVLGRKLHGYMLAERRRAFAYVDSHVEYIAFHHTHELALSMLALLEMKTTQHAIARLRLVVLYEMDGAHFGVKLLLIVRFKEIATGIGKHARFNDDHSGYVCFNNIHCMIPFYGQNNE